MRIKFFALLISVAVLSITALGKGGYAATLEEIAPETFAHMMEGGEEIKFVFIFTSWCGVCKSLLGQVMALADRYSGEDRVKIVMLSIDHKSSQLEYLIERLSESEVIIYSTLKLNKEQVANMFQQNKIGFMGRIPHMTIFHKKSVIGDDIYEIDSVRQLIDHVLAGDAK
jgi:thiol-disulfide isomerase/thioredoxin